MDDNKHGRGTAHSTSWATPSAYEKQSDGDPAKLQDGVPVIMKVIDLMPCREAGGGDGRILLMFQTASDLQPGTLELCQAGLQK